MRRRLNREDGDNEGYSARAVGHVGEEGEQGRQIRYRLGSAPVRVLQIAHSEPNARFHHNLTGHKEMITGVLNGEEVRRRR